MLSVPTPGQSLLVGGAATGRSPFVQHLAHRVHAGTPEGSASPRRVPDAPGIKSGLAAERMFGRQVLGRQEVTPIARPRICLEEFLKQRRLWRVM